MAQTIEHLEKALLIVIENRDNIKNFDMLYDQLDNAICHYKIEKRLPPYDEERDNEDKFKTELTFEEQRHGRFVNDKETSEDRTEEETKKSS